MNSGNRGSKRKAESLPVTSPTDKPTKKKRNWNESFAALVAYKEEFGTAHVPRSYVDTALSKWVVRQRSYQRKLTSDQRQKLVYIGFKFLIDRSDGWDTMFAELEKFKAANGHCRVQRAHKDGLGGWVHNQRQRYRKNLMNKDRQSKLESIGFEWKLKNHKRDRSSKIDDGKWFKNYEKLVEIHIAHGACNINGIDDAQLSNWVDNQRRHNSKNILRKDRKELLDRIGFEWNPTRNKTFQNLWDKNFCMFLEYKVRHGWDTKIPSSYAEGGNVGSWVSNQSQIFRDGDMEAQRALLLLDAGFPYASEKFQSWKARYEQLKTVLSSSKNIKEKSNPSLLRWTRLQRVLRSNNVLELSRIDLLNKIGFSWR